jgi:hypothetical protein
LAGSKAHFDYDEMTRRNVELLDEWFPDRR